MTTSKPRKQTKKELWLGAKESKLAANQSTYLLEISLPSTIDATDLAEIASSVSQYLADYYTGSLLELHKLSERGTKSAKSTKEDTI